MVLHDRLGQWLRIDSCCLGRHQDARHELMAGRSRRGEPGPLRPSRALPPTVGGRGAPSASAPLAVALGAGRSGLSSGEGPAAGTRT